MCFRIVDCAKGIREPLEFATLAVAKAYADARGLTDCEVWDSRDRCIAWRAGKSWRAGTVPTVEVQARRFH